MAKERSGRRKRYSIGDGGKIVRNYVIEEEGLAFVLPARHDCDSAVVHVRPKPVGGPPVISGRGGGGRKRSRGGAGGGAAARGRGGK